VGKCLVHNYGSLNDESALLNAGYRNVPSFRSLTLKRSLRMLVYNLSPSFNWAAQGFDDGRLRSFIWDLAKEGSVSRHSWLSLVRSRAFADKGRHSVIQLRPPADLRRGTAFVRFRDV
jgi:hypothetical protein